MKKMKKMEKKRILLLIIVLIPSVLSGQQFPIMQGYNNNPYNLSPAFAGIKNDKTFFVIYHSDWMGIDGGPTTYQLSYSDKFRQKNFHGGDHINEKPEFYRNTAAFGGKFIYDRTDIFSQLLLLGTYTYDIRINREHRINFALSAGFYKNGVNYSKYLSDPNYMQDIVLTYGQESSKFSFASDVAALYRYRKVEAGIVFSSVMYGTIRYYDSNKYYQPFKTVLLHGSCLFEIDKKWTIEPILVLRGGHDINTQFEISPTVTWNKRFWGTAFYRTEGIFGMGFGGEFFKGITLNYSYNMISNVSLYSFGTSQLSLGIKLFGYSKDKKN